MENTTLTKVALRYRAIYLNINRKEIDMNNAASAPVLAFAARLKENSFSVSEELLHALNSAPIERLVEITECVNDIMGVNLNWAPLVKGWNVPTGESLADHLITLIANIFGEQAGFKGTRLPCGHLIPENTFPLERYNGCPFCGTPFKTAHFIYKGQGSKLRELRLFTKEDMENVFTSLLTSPTPLDGTQQDSLKQLLTVFQLPDNVNITMKETAMLAIHSLVGMNKPEAALRLLKTPADILRYLWYEKINKVRVIEPKTLIKHSKKLYYHIFRPLNRSVNAAKEMKRQLRLKYNRKTCRTVAFWLNSIDMTAQEAAENMNPKRGMWVRLIRALRLSEYAHKQEFSHLAEILDVFYRQEYSTWQGKVDKARIENDAYKTLALLKTRPGMFARCLFATMLRFGSDKALSAFSEVADKLPARLLISLGNAAEAYFDPTHVRLAQPLTGGTKRIEPNKLLALYGSEDKKAMTEAATNLYKESMFRRFKAAPSCNKTIYIAPSLFQIPISVGDRSATIQDASCALQGTRFPIEGEAVRLFLQWGKGLHAQHLDMDLSCEIAFPGNKTECCYFGNLTCTGAKHSGDIRSIPEMVGTAEYIELSMPELVAAGATYVTFTCNAYSCGALSPNLVVGWMDSANPMAISEKTGVAYNPSCVQHFVRISESNLSKGLVFGVLDVARREIIWLEMPFTAQTIHSADNEAVMALLQKLDEKLTIGELLNIKAETQGLTPIENATEADEAYTYDWALNPADVTKLLNNTI